MIGPLQQCRDLGPQAGRNVINGFQPLADKVGSSIALKQAKLSFPYDRLRM